MAEADEGIAES